VALEPISNLTTKVIVFYTRKVTGNPDLEVSTMGLGVGIFLLAIGAVLAFAINVSTAGGIDLHTVGWILMGVGALGIVLSMVFWSSWAGPGYFSRDRRGPGVTSTTIEQ
jgi:hypothetical protein